MPKNSRIYLWLETDLKQQIEKKALEEKISISEYCRNKLIDSPQIAEIKNSVEEVLSILKNTKIYKGGCIKSIK